MTVVTMTVTGTNLKFIDLFAGIGGIRTGMTQAGFDCVFSSEIDKYARQTYMANYQEEPHGDITKIKNSDIPNHDVLVGGFPCQAFSLAGKKLGFEDTRGTLFFEIARIIKSKRPKAFLLENVKNLMSHDKGKTFKTILKVLEDLDYKVFYQVVSSESYVPQKRERIYIVGFDKKQVKKINFEFPEASSKRPTVGDILDSKVDPKYTLSPKLWNYLQEHARRHAAKGNGFGFGLVGPKDQSRTLSARYGKDGSEILIRQSKGNPRRLTPRECARLMGFGEEFKIVVSDTQAYKQFGNCVVVPVIYEIAKRIKDQLNQGPKAK